MGSRKDLIKTTLGISDYPWSSEDEVEEAPTSTEDLNARRPPPDPQPSTTDPPGPSRLSAPAPAVAPQHQESLRGQALQQQLAAASRRQARQDRELFWSIINSPHRISSANQPYRSRGSEAARVASAPQLWSSMGRRPDMQRYGDYKRITIDLRNPRNDTTAAPRANPGVIVPSESNSGIIINRHLRRATVRPQPQQQLFRNGRGTTLEIPPSWDTATTASLLGESSNSDRRRAQFARAASILAIRDRRFLRAQRNARASPDGQPETAPAPEPVLNADDEANNNPSTSVAPEPEAMDETNHDLIDRNEHLDAFDVGEMENTGANVTLEEEIVAIDLDNNDEPAPTASTEEDTSAPATVPDQTDGRFETDARHHAAGGDAGTSNDGVNANTGMWQFPEEQRESRKRKNSNDVSEPQTVKEFNLNLLRLLECPVCLEWMEPPMSQCRRGHLVCGVCRARLASCPVCRTTFSSVRNRAMEGVAELLRYPCRHGCGKEVRLRRRTPHEASCLARKYHCPAPVCVAAAPMPLAVLAAHFQNNHLTMIKFGRQHRFSVKLNSEQHDNWLIMAMDQFFHLKVDVDRRAICGLVVYVAYIGPKCDAKNYTYEVTIDGQHNQRKLMYARTTHSDLESSSINVSRQDCFHLTHDQALNFTRVKNRRSDAEKILDISLQISKVERPLEAIEESSDS